MIVFRYLSRELLVTMSAVSAVLLVIIMSGRFVKYLAEAARGILDPSVLLQVMLYRVPGFLELILPLGLFLGILLAYGRLYLESEMTVLLATGMSPQRLLLYTFGAATLVALLVGWLSLALAPQGVRAADRILKAQNSLTEFDTLVPGRFQALQGGTRVTYTQKLSKDRTQLESVFISEKRLSGDKSQTRDISVLVAESGHQEVQPDGSRYLVLRNGYRYDGNPGEADYREVRFDSYGVLMPKPALEREIVAREAMPTERLIGSKKPQNVAELQWRLSIPIMVFIVTLLAVPLAKANPRQGRYLKLLPAIVLYMSYLALLIVTRGALEKGRIPPYLGLWWVHGLFLAIGMLLVYWEALQLWLAARRAARGVAHG